MSKIISIETSCDETAVSVLDCSGDTSGATISVLGDALYSQAEKHALYGGVYPTLAKREHQGNLVPLAIRALREAKMLKIENAGARESDVEMLRDPLFKEAVRQFLSGHEKPTVDFIAVTRGPGLEPALWTGITFAQALGKAWSIPVMGIDHMEAHIISALLTQSSERTYRLSDIPMPLLSLLVSGGHTELVLANNWFEYEIVGRTKDDAVGEAFDKVARLLELTYPGGPEIARLAKVSREQGPAVLGNDRTPFSFPRPLANDATCDFSFSGLKTAVLYKLRSLDELSETDKENIAQAFEEAAIETLVMKTRRALAERKPKTLAIGGGVSANELLQDGITELIEKEFPKVALYFPDKSLTGDNAIMVGAAAYLRHASGQLEENELIAKGNLDLSRR